MRDALSADGYIYKLYAIEKRVTDISQDMVKSKELDKMRDLANRQGVTLPWLFSDWDLEEELKYRRKIARQAAPCCFACRRKL